MYHSRGFLSSGNIALSHQDWRLPINRPQLRHVALRGTSFLSQQFYPTRHSLVLCPRHTEHICYKTANMSNIDSTVAPATTPTSPLDNELRWRPHIVHDQNILSKRPAEEKEHCDWVKNLELSGAVSFIAPGSKITHSPRILILYGSLRQTSYSRFLAFECARILDLLGADVRVFTPNGLPVRDPALEKTNEKVLELRSLAEWSEGHVWVSPEMHGQITGVMKNQIDWIPLNTGSVRPTQGKTVAVLQVNGGSQSFNAVNTLRLLARWMRMPCCTNQSSVAKAWKEFDEDGRMKPSDFRDRVVDVMEEFYKFTLILREHADFLVDRYSEREEKRKEGKLLTQAEKEHKKDLPTASESS